MHSSRMLPCWLSVWVRCFAFELDCCVNIGLRDEQVLSNWWLSVWAGQTQAAGDHLTVGGLHFYLGIYSVIGMASLASQAIRGVFMLFGMLNASRVLHSDLVNNVSAGACELQHF